MGETNDRLNEYLDNHLCKVCVIRALLYPLRGKTRAYLRSVAQDIMEVYAILPEAGESWNETANRYMVDKPEGAWLLKEAEVQFYEVE